MYIHTRSNITRSYAFISFLCVDRVSKCVKLYSVVPLPIFYRYFVLILTYTHNAYYFTINSEQCVVRESFLTGCLLSTVCMIFTRLKSPFRKNNEFRFFFYIEINEKSKTFVLNSVLYRYPV